MRSVRTIAFALALIATAVVATWVVMRQQQRTDGAVEVVSPAPLTASTPVTASSSNACNGSATAPSAEALAEGPKVNTDPTLQIEAGEHIGAIRSLSLAKSGAFAVTAGWDKTIRVWGLGAPAAPGEATARPALNDVLRVPIGNGRAGEAYAVAVAPDEASIAVGGGMSNEIAPDLERVYIFDKLTARVAQVLPVAQKVYALAYSTDGAYLAAGAAAGVGLCVWSTKDWRLVGNDADYSGQINGIDFSSDGRIVTTSEDGNIRVYAALASGALKPAKRTDALLAGTAQLEPYTAAFSPNAALIAVGYRDSAAVTLFASSDLTKSAALKAAADGAEQNFPRVAWSNDGKALFAAGQSAAATGAGATRTFVRRWAVDQSSTVSSLNGASSTDLSDFNAAGGVQAIAPFGDAGAAAVTHDGRIFTFGADGKVQHLQTPTRFDWSAADAAAAASGFKASADGRVVEVNLDDGSFVRFDIARRALALGSAAAPGLTAAKTRGASLAVDIDDAQNPTLKKSGGQPVDILVAEPPISLALAPREKFFALGTHFNIRLYDDAGELLATESVTDSVHRVLVLQDERTVVAALGDGTIRWYAIVRPKDQQRWNLEERLALFARASDGKWVAWTPNGYYDAAADGEELMGWLLNRGSNASALFYSSGRFRNLYRRPAFVDKALTTAALEPAPATETFLAKIPPVVRITSVSSTSQSARVKYELEWPSQADKVVEEVFGAVDGLPERGRGFTAMETEQAIDLPVPEGSGARRISLVARTPQSALSDPAILVVPNLRTSASDTPGVLRAVVVGVSDYRSNQIKDLTYADDDAVAVEGFLNKQKNGRYTRVEVTRLTNDGATRAAIDGAMKALPRKPGPNDLTVLFLAGHGTLQNVRPTPGAAYEEPTFFFLPTDAGANGALIDPKTALSIDDIAAAFLDRIDGRKVVFVDACRSGQWGRQDGTMTAESVRDTRPGVIVYGASTGDQLALEDRAYAGGHGAFTAALIEAFEGPPAFNRQDPARFTPRELAVWLDRRVPQLTNNRQQPVPLDNSGVAFPMARTVGP